MGVRTSIARSLLRLAAVCVAIAIVSGQTPQSAQSPDVPEWQIAAGGKIAFEVASVKPSKDFKLPNFDLSTGNSVAPGGRFYAGFRLMDFITFAYKLQLTDEQRRTALAQIPKRVNTDFYVIEARAAGNATKDQMRLMMQSLLAERFQLAVHFETREGPVLALTLDNPGELGRSSVRIRRVRLAPNSRASMRPLHSRRPKQAMRFRQGAIRFRCRVEAA